MSEAKLPFIDQYNVTNEWQGHFRTGVFDLVATKYALKANGGVDALVVTHTDEVCPTICDTYISELRLPANIKEQSQLTKEMFNHTAHTVGLTAPFIKEISDRLNLPVVIESFGARSDEKKCMM